MPADMWTHDCGRRVLVATTVPGGKRILLDADPNPRGSYASYRDGTGTWLARSLQGKDAHPKAGFERVYMPHVATCPGRQPRELVPAGPAELPAGVVSLDAARARKRSARR